MYIIYITEKVKLNEKNDIIRCINQKENEFERKHNKQET